MIRLQPTQLDGKLHFINQYIQAKKCRRRFKNGRQR
ncbi:hypothetical protein EFIBHEMM_01107 [Mannheimia haemolytica]